MVKQWVQPPVGQNRMVPRSFLLGSHLTSFIHYFYYEGVHWNIRGRLQNPVPAIYIIFKKGINQI